MPRTPVPRNRPPCPAFAHSLLVSAVLLGAASLVGACATTGGGSSPGGRSVVAPEELLATGTSNLLQALQTARPEWFRSRGPRSLRDAAESGLPKVVVDGYRRGDLGELRQISVSDVASVEYVGASEATTRWGTGFTGGAIVVSTRGGGS